MQKPLVGIPADQQTIQLVLAEVYSGAWLCRVPNLFLALVVRDDKTNFQSFFFQLMRFFPLVGIPADQQTSQALIVIGKDANHRSLIIVSLRSFKKNAPLRLCVTKLL
ncbi:MAG: hypothetical protein ACPG4Y_07080 [Chitinophagales bacterium]